MQPNPTLPSLPSLPAIPERTLPLAATLFVVLALLLVPGPVTFIVLLAAAIGFGLTVADWRRAPDAPRLNGTWSA
jgi:hypothetical protein